MSLKRNLYLTPLKSGFFNLASGVFAGSSGDGSGADGPYLYGTNGMYNYEYTQAFSVGIWVFAGPRNGDGAVTFVSKLYTTPDGVTTQGWSLGALGASTVNNSTSVSFQLCNSPTNRIAKFSAAFHGDTANNDLHLGVWSFVCATYDGSGTSAGLNIYVNGVLAPALTNVDALGGNSVLSSAPFTIGGLSTDTGGPGIGEGYCRYKGNLNQATVWNKALSSLEVAALYSFNNGAPSDPRIAGPAVNLVGYYPLVASIDSSSVIHDVVGGNNLTNSGVTLNGALLPNPLYQNASSGSFDGATSYLDLGNKFGTNVATSAVTYSMWVNLASLPASGQRYVIFQKASAGGVGIICQVNNFAGSDTSSLHVQINDSGGGRIVVDGPTGVFAAGTWVNLVICYDGSKSASGVTMYANGSALTTTTQINTLTGSADVGDSFLLGQFQSVRFFNGLLDEFAIFNTVVNPSDITSSIYKGGHPGDISHLSGLLSWFRFENGGQYTGYAADDSSQISDRIGFVVGTNHGVTFSATVP